VQVNTAPQSDRCHQNGPLAGICPYVITSSSLVPSPSLPAAVDLSVCHADDLPLNLSVSTTAAVQCLFQAVGEAAARPASSACLRQWSDAGHCEGGLSEAVSLPPPAHCHVTAAPAVLDSKLSADALTRLQTQWTVLCHENRFTDTSSISSATSTGCTPRLRCSDDALRSLDVLSVAAALRSEMSDGRLSLTAADDTPTTPPSVNSCQVRQ